MKRILLLFIFFITAHAALGLAQGPQGAWTAQETRHFIIYFRSVPDDFIRNVANSAESYYEDIIKELGFSRYYPRAGEEKIKIYIYNDQDDYMSAGQQKSWSNGVAYAFRKEIFTFPSAHGFFDSTLPHELGHIVLQEFVGPNMTMPLWFEEGVAMYQEKGKRWGAHRIVKKAIQEKKFISLMDLFNVRLYNHTQRNLVELYYAESASVVYYMISELGPQRFVHLCRYLQDGRPFILALTDAYSRFGSIEDLNRCWMSYVGSQ